VQLLRQHHDAEWELLSVRELREHERVQLGTQKVTKRPGWLVGLFVLSLGLPARIGISSR